jgi:hypothetical protein
MRGGSARTLSGTLTEGLSSTECYSTTVRNNPHFTS